MPAAPTAKGKLRRRQLVVAAAQILGSTGPDSVTLRDVAKRVGCSLSATTYYFQDRDELLEEAGRYNISCWASRAETVAERIEASPPVGDREATIDVLLKAMLPADEPLLGHYLQLIAAGASVPVSRAYFTGRERLNSAMSRALRALDVNLSAELVVTVIDGAAVSALSEGRDVHETARVVLRELLGLAATGH